MKESISYTFLLNIMIAFIVVSFCIIAGILSYSKSFRVNSKIANAIELYEGYNEKSLSEITRATSNLGYGVRNVNCPKKGGQDAVVNENGYCLYRFDDANNYYSYGIITYMQFDIPVISNFLKIPIYSKTEKIYNFSKEG